jgi:DNA-binding NarL/FixJ family response regulator
MRVLILDDQPAFRRAARFALRAGGHEVVAEADCAESALALLAPLSPDAVFLGEERGFDSALPLIGARPDLAVMLARL